jgi:hypothetical protein
MTPDKIIPLYVVIDDILKSQGHQDQKLVQVTDAEIITAAVVSAKYFNSNHERGLGMMKLVNYITNSIGMPQFNKRLHKLSRVIEYVIEVLFSLERTKEIYIIDSMPILICKYYRSGRSRKAKGKQYYGYCAAKGERFFGFRLHLICNADGCPVNFTIQPASCHEITQVETLVSLLPSGSRVAADKGYISAKIEGLVHARYGVRLVVSHRKNMLRNTPEDTAFIRQHRSRIETLHSRLQKMGIQHLHARTLQGMFLKIKAALIAAVCPFL